MCSGYNYYNMNLSSSVMNEEVAFCIQSSIHWMCIQILLERKAPVYILCGENKWFTCRHRQQQPCTYTVKEALWLRLMSAQVSEVRRTTDWSSKVPWPCSEEAIRILWDCTSRSNQKTIICKDIGQHHCQGLYHSSVRHVMVFQLETDHDYHIIVSMCFLYKVAFIVCLFFCLWQFQLYEQFLCV